MQSMKETAANIAASAKAGMEKTKAAVQEKVDRMSAHDPIQKEMATEKKHERVAQAELNKQEAREHNSAAKQAAAIPGRHAHYTTSGTGTHTDPATGVPGYPMGAQQMSAFPGHGAGQPCGGQVEESVERVDLTGLPGETTGHNTRVGDTGYGYGTGTGGNAPGYGTGGSYS